MSEDKFEDDLAEFLKNEAADPKAARNAIALLFPKIREELGGFFSLRDTAADRKTDRRIANQDYASSYFRLEPARPLWKKSEIRNLVTAQDPRQAFIQVDARVSELSEEDRAEMLRHFFEQLEALFESQQAHFTQRWFDTIVWFSPTYIRAFNPESELLVVFDNGMRLQRVVFRGLKQHDEAGRVLLFVNAIEVAEDLTLLCGLFRNLAGDKVGDRDTTNPDREVGFGDRSEEVREQLLAKVRRYAQLGLLWKQASPDRIIWFWWSSDREQEVKEFTSQQMESAEGVRSLLKFSLSLVRSTGGNYERVPRIVGKVLDLLRLRKLAVDISRSKAPDAELAKRFLVGLQRSESGPFGEY